MAYSDFTLEKVTLEKARSEMIIAPILLDLRKQVVLKIRN